MRRCFLPLLLATLTAVPASAEVFYIPASANVEGANNTRWRTDLQIKAQGGESAAFSIELLETRQNNSEPVGLDFTVAADQSLRLDNAIETAFSHEGTAALRLTATAGTILATSRTYNDDPSGTYGQTVPAVAETNGLAFGDTATLIQLSRSPDPAAGFRTNVGLLNLTVSRTRVVIDLYLADGTQIGSLPYQLKAYEHRQINDVFAVAGASDVADGYAVIRTTDEHGRFLAYASVVDNGSGDAVFIPGSADAPLPPASTDRVVVLESLLRPG